MTDVRVQAAGCAIYVVVWLLLLRDQWPWLPLGRAVSALLGAALFVAAGVLAPRDAFASINMETIALLTGCMLVSAHLEKRGGYAALSRALEAHGSPHAFLGRVCVAAAVAAALLTNDTACVILTPIVLSACGARRLHPAPFLLALATSANIGASCSPIGSPQNMIIATTGDISFLRFLGYLGVPTLIGVACNFCIIAVAYRGALSAGAPAWVGVHDDHAVSGLAEAGPAAARLTAADADAVAVAGSADAGRGGRPAAPAARWGVGGRDGRGGSTGSDDGSGGHAEAVAGGSRGDGGARAAPHPPPHPPPPPPRESHAGDDATTHAVVAVAGAAALALTTGTPAAPLSPPPPPPAAALAARARRWAVLALLAAFPCVLIAADSWIGLGWTALLFAAALCVADGSPPAALLARVDGGLLLFFSGLFVCVAGLNATGVPQDAWNAIQDAVNVRTTSGVAAFTLVVLLGSQVVSNVPLVLIMAPKILAMPPADAALAWALLSWVSTVAGNLTLLGSVANLIVAERCRADYELTFVEYARVGVPSTLLMCAMGVPLAWALVNAIDGG